MPDPKHKSGKRPTAALLLRPYLGSLTAGLAAVLVEGTTNLAEPWPLKIVLDNILESKPTHG